MVGGSVDKFESFQGPESRHAECPLAYRVAGPRRDALPARRRHDPVAHCARGSLTVRPANADTPDELTGRAIGTRLHYGEGEAGSGPAPRAMGFDSPVRLLVSCDRVPKPAPHDRIAMCSDQGRDVLLGPWAQQEAARCW